LLRRAEYQATYRQFLNRLREARKQAGLTQAEVAERLGKPQSFVSKCESGERRVDFVELVALSRLYGVEFDYFSAPTRDVT
jgi:transcriptional regulator with XRE-family HTH domain